MIKVIAQQKEGYDGLGGESMSILLKIPRMTKKFGIKDRIKTKIGRIVVIAIVTAYVTVTVLGLTAINPGAFSGMLG